LCLQAYDALTKKLRELDALNGISGLLGWDELVRATTVAADLSPMQHTCAYDTAVLC
jgi:hypothetical protein